MAIYQGDTKISGNAKVSSLPLFTTQWQDHITNDASWLRSETFSWQSGSVYTSAYAHLVADISGITSETETVAGTTITFKRATDGHKIVDDTQVSNVEAIYTATGIAWYYVLDTTNTRFKLPRSTHGNIVEKYQNGTNWYRIYSDGWCEQGGTSSGAAAVDYMATIVFSKQFANTDYTLLTQAGRTNNDQSYINNQSYVYSKSATGFSAICYGDGSSSFIAWEAKGYISSPAENAQYKYLYFYVGNTIQNETSVDVAELTEELNDKVDVDLTNLDLSNLTNANKIIVSKMSTPSSVYDNLTVVPNGGTYTAPANGYFCARLPFTGNQAFEFYNATQLLGNQATCNGSWTGYTFIPVQKGDVVYVYYNCTPNLVRFVYAEGSKSEQ